MNTRERITNNVWYEVSPRIVNVKGREMNEIEQEDKRIAERLEARGFSAWYDADLQHWNVTLYGESPREVRASGRTLYDALDEAITRREEMAGTAND